MRGAEEGYPLCKRHIDVMLARTRKGSKLIPQEGTTARLSEELLRSAMRTIGNGVGAAVLGGLFAGGSYAGAKAVELWPKVVAWIEYLIATGGLFEFVMLSRSNATAKRRRPIYYEAHVFFRDVAEANPEVAVALAPHRREHTTREDISKYGPTGFQVDQSWAALAELVVLRAMAGSTPPEAPKKRRSKK